MSENGPGKVVAADGHVYHKSATANATTAPTNAATLDNAAGIAGLSSEEAEFVVLIDYEWHLKGQLAIEAFCEEYGYEVKEFKDFVKRPQVLSNLTGRGIPPHLVYPDALTEQAAKRVQLLPLQLKAANAIMDLTDTRTTKKKLQDLGLTTSQYQAWLRDPKFNDYLRQRAEALMGDVQHEAALALVDKVMAGDMKAIEYYNEMTGRYVRPTATAVGGSQQDFQMMVVRIIEIIVDEVEDPQVAARISDRLKGLASGMQVAGMLQAPEVIEQPEVAPARVITPEVQAMMNKGLGYNS